MKSKNIPEDIKRKSIKEVQNEIQEINKKKDRRNVFKFYIFYQSQINTINYIYCFKILI